MKNSGEDRDVLVLGYGGQAKVQSGTRKVGGTLYLEDNGSQAECLGRRGGGDMVRLLFFGCVGLRCCAQAFSSYGAWAADCGAFSCYRARAPGHMGFSSWQAQAQ